MRKKDKDTYVDPVHIDIWLTVILLLALGLMVVFSAGAYKAASSEDYSFDVYYFLKRQAVFAIAGLVLMFFAQYVKITWLAKKLAIMIYLISIISILLLNTSLGVTVNGATRWLMIGGKNGIRFQVAELVKVGVIVMLAYIITKYRRYRGSIKFTIYLWIIILIPAALLLIISDDLSSTIVVLLCGFGITVFNTRTWKSHLAVVGAAVAFAATYVWNIYMNMPSPEDVKLEKVPFRVARIAAWLDPQKYKDSAAFQTLNGLYGIGRGKVFGVGLGRSIQKLGPVPEAETDMIFTVLVEELGLVGAGILLFLYGFLAFLLVKVAIRAVNIDLWEAIFVEGVCLHIVGQALINISVCLGVIPNTGITLPFISYGGTSLLIVLTEIAVVLSIARKQMVIRIRQLQRKREEIRY